ncbi:hypothetical protein V1477_000038 [Vespula maculifrons]|uniref:Uncharacterized protein n=1 Tax=Vespula maculifrons TaxID=7453 RepID=A0ABD2D477_VESMC
MCMFLSSLSPSFFDDHIKCEIRKNSSTKESFESIVKPNRIHTHRFCGSTSVAMRRGCYGRWRKPREEPLGLLILPSNQATTYTKLEPNCSEFTERLFLSNPPTSRCLNSNNRPNERKRGEIAVICRRAMKRRTRRKTPDKALYKMGAPIRTKARKQEK